MRITVQSLRGTQTMTYTDNQGLFEIRNLPVGNYTLEVEPDKLRFENTAEHIEVYKGSSLFVTIALREKARADKSKPATNVVSAAELTQTVPNKARKEFDRANAFLKQGKREEAVDHLRKAIALFPQYLMAHNDLGAQLLEQGLFDEAEREFQRAIEIDPKAFNPQLNLGIVLVRQQRFAEASNVLRKALVLESTSASAKFFLGLSLLGQEDYSGAESELKAAYALGGSQYALALFHLGEVYMNRGERALALQAFEAYLREVPNATNADQTRKLIALLR
jgi:Flp pilus assembly protein TadD